MKTSLSILLSSFTPVVARSLTLGAALTLAACGSSSDEPEQSKSYVQFYNGATATANPTFKLDDTSISSASFAEASNVISVDTADYTLDVTETGSNSPLLSDEISLSQDQKHLFIMTSADEQFDYLSLSFAREKELEDQFDLYLTNLAASQPQLDIYLSEATESFADATLLDSVTLHEISNDASRNATGKYNVYLAEAGADAPLFVGKNLDFSFENTYVLVVRDQHGPIAEQLAVDVILNSSSVAHYAHQDAQAQFRLYNSLTQPVQVALDNSNIASLATAELGTYYQLAKGDYSLSVRDTNDQLLLNSALLTAAAGESQLVLLYQNENNQLEALAIKESDKPQIQANDVIVSNLVADFSRLNIYFIREDETIATARHNIKNLEFKKQHSLNLPKDYYAIALVHVAENGSTTLLDKTDSLMLQADARYLLTAEQDDSAPSGYRVNLTF
ncbi:hypothetical protein SAMN06297280_2400 [Arsukibacterium tuosuense]|uniref:DUF4397 domain-containing protein n=1 Tax=Arsukibacterium tuosuense TaxID=1323745 RepID=A0A285J2P2_9GAMM|nr:DUF4397 domain-containing protein [Arsukibacterium tuosuense]SNY53401.1 hypothetical protein SAMN06297280_2400 [Arsukibacterium tuosuense]